MTATFDGPGDATGALRAGRAPRRGLLRLAGAIGLALVLAMAGLTAAPDRIAAKIPEADAASIAALGRVEAWFAETQTLKARFVQVNDMGQTATGTVWLRRPGRVRFEYDPPVPLLIVADGLFVVFVDQELEQADRMPLIRSPLSILTAEEVDLQRDTDLRGVSHDAGVIRVTVADPESPEEGEVTLVFRDSPIALRQWVVRDPAGKETTITLQDTQTNLELPQRLFVYTDPAPASGRPGR